jgi:hypothetical protein
VWWLLLLLGALWLLVVLRGVKSAMAVCELNNRLTCAIPKRG